MEQETHQESSSPFSFLISAIERMLQDRTPKKVQQLHLPVDIADEGSVYTAQIDIPGYAPESLELLAKGETLTINITQKIQTQDTKVWITRERNAAPATRTVVFPRNAALTLAIAQYEHGLLTITIPKNEETPVRIPIFSAKTRVEAEQGYASSERTETQPLTTESAKETFAGAPEEYSVVFSHELISQDDLNHLAQQIAAERAQKQESEAEQAPAAPQELFPEFELEEGYAYIGETAPEEHSAEEISIIMDEEVSSAESIAAEENADEAISAEAAAISKTSELSVAPLAAQDIDAGATESPESLSPPIENFVAAETNTVLENTEENIGEELPLISDNAITQPMTQQTAEDIPTDAELTQSAAIEEAEQILSSARATTHFESPAPNEMDPEYEKDSEREAAMENVSMADAIAPQEIAAADVTDHADEFLPIESFREDMHNSAAVAEETPAVIPDVVITDDAICSGGPDVLPFTKTAGNSDSAAPEISDIDRLDQLDQDVEPENLHVEGGEMVQNSAANAEVSANDSADLKKAS